VILPLFTFTAFYNKVSKKRVDSMKKKKLVFIIIIIIVSIILVFTFIIKKNKADYTAQEREWISRNKDEIFFMGYYNSSGEALFVKKLCEILSKETGLNIVPYEDTWDNTMLLFQRGKIPMACTLDITTERLKYTNYTASLKSLSSGIYSCLKNPINNYEGIKGKNIGVVKSVKFLSMFKEKYKGISFNTILYDDVGSMINGLKSHEIDGFISTKNYDWSTRDLYYFNIPTISKDNNHIGVHKNYPKLHSIVTKEVDHLIDIGWSDTVREAINFEIEKQHLPFNEVEMSYLETKSIITIGIINDNILCGYKKNYSVHGIIPNVCEKIKFLTDIEFEYVFDSYENLLGNDRVDLIATSSYDDKHYIYSNPIFTYTVSVLGRQDMPFVRELYDLEPYRIGVLSGGNQNDYLIQQMPQIDIHKYDDFTQLLDSVESLKSEYVVLPNVMVDVYISQSQDLDKKGILYESFTYMMAKDNTNTSLINIINKCLAVVNIEDIMSKEVDELADNKPNNRVQLIAAMCAIVALLVGIINLAIKKRIMELNLMYTDSLTGVHNRLWIDKELKKGIKEYIFFVVKLKDLFMLHECYGEGIYEKTLRAAIKAIQENLKRKDIFAIIDKEKFVIAKAHITDYEGEVFARELARIFGEKILIYDMSYDIKGIVGWTTIEDDINKFDAVIECLNIASYFAEKEDKIVRYSYEIFSKYKDRFEFDKQFVSSVMNEELELLYRNVYDEDGKVFALDTAVTCYLKDYGHLNSKTFYEATKRLSLQGQVDVIVLKNIIKQLRKWKEQGKMVRVLVSLHDETIAKYSFIPWLVDIMNGLENMNIMIKLEDKALEDHMEQLIFLEHKSIGFVFKNFGNNVLNMVEMRSFPVGIVCIDNDFILNIGEDKLYDETLDYIISVAKKMNQRIMVTDIISKNQYDAIVTRDVDYISGNYINPYVRGDELLHEDIGC
jgi:EAL domain-containing protein (putative c-di-GMP-specific phosphodiesterase class I)/ABC-type amino acid transport substrate-binding protein/GGDEF domain-containing protein